MINFLKISYKLDKNVKTMQLVYQAVICCVKKSKAHSIKRGLGGKKFENDSKHCLKCFLQILYRMHFLFIVLNSMKTKIRMLGNVRETF
jgi:hypothetical protein